MLTDRPARYPLLTEEVGAALAHLDGIQGRVVALEELLTIASARNRTEVSVWAEAMIDTLRDCTLSLTRAIEKAPVDGG